MFKLELLAGALLFAPVLIWILNRILLWMDAHSWIIIPNKEALRSAEVSAMKPLLEIQALVEPAKRHLIKARESEELRRDQAEQGDSPEPSSRGPATS